MATLMLHRQILKNFSKLPVKVQKRVSEFIDVFQKDPNEPSLHLHSLKESMMDPKVRGANLPDGYRAIVIAPERGDNYLLVHIDSHDDAYNWARNKRFDVNEQTGIFQVFDVEEINQALENKIDDIPVENNYPLVRLSETDLIHVGVPRPLIPAVQAIKSDSALDTLSEYLPFDCRDVLYGIAAGMSVDDALKEMLGLDAEQRRIAKPKGTGDFSNIEVERNYDLIVIDGEEHFKQILAAPLEEWRLFLHPYQKKLVQWETNGPMCISGSAGTGKTVSLIHRAIHLAKKLTDAKQHVLLTTFTTNLSITIKHYIKQLDSDAAEKIQVTNLHALSRTICNRTGWQGRIATEEEIEDIWNDVLTNSSISPMPMSREEIKEEYRLVIEPNGIDTEDEYLTTVRTGRPRISRKQRQQAWFIFRDFQRALKKRNLLTFEGAIHQARLSVENGKFPKYRYVLVDEVQDFSLEALRLICALSPIGENLKDPLCVVGDGHQRIYRSRIPLSRAGIIVTGRSRRLKVNYRTSEQIRKYAHGILQGIEIDDLDDGTAAKTGDHSIFKGPEPWVMKCANESEEADLVVDWVKELGEKHGLKPHEICITPYKSDVRAKLVAAGLQTYELKPREEDPGADEPGVRLGSMKRIKGLEFRAIAMACANPSDPMNDLTTSDHLQRCERYVAATRAREFLLITISKS